MSDQNPLTIAANAAAATRTMTWNTGYPNKLTALQAAVAAAKANVFVAQQNLNEMEAELKYEEEREVERAARREAYLKEQAEKEKANGG